MRKKLYSILAFIFLLFASFGLSACKGKYDNLQFRVYYAFSADSENWQDGTSGINCFYGEDEGSLRLDSNGNAKIYIKIDVENVKAKNVDTIFVSKQTATNASTFSSATVKENQVFEVEVSGKLSMTLKLLETNSQKSALVNVSASVPLEDIEVDNSIKPAVMVGKQLNLAQFKDEILTFKPLDETNNTLTNQTAVNYAVSAVGYFDAANEFVAAPNSNSIKTALKIDSSILSVDSTYLFSNSSYAVQISATSVDKPTISKNFYVYLVQDSNYSPVIKYKNADGELDLNGAINLYSNSKYSRADLSISSFYNGAYSAGVNAKEGNIKITFKAYESLTGNEIVFGEPVLDAGLLFNHEEGGFSISTTSSNNISNFQVSFVAEFEGLNFGTDAPAFNNSTEISINKLQLPSSININNETFENLGEYNSTIYSINGAQTPLNLRLTINNPTSNNQKIIVSDFADFALTSGSALTGNEAQISNNSLLRVEFASAKAESQFLVKVQSSPEYFQGKQVEEIEYTTVTVKIKNVVTADEFKLFYDANRTVELTSNSLDVAVGEENAFYLRTYFTGSNNLDFSSVVLTSNSNNIKFKAVNDVTLSLDKIAYLSSGVDGNKSYYDFAIMLSSIELQEQANLTISSGNNAFRRAYTICPRIVSNGEFEVNTSVETEYATKLNINNGQTNFAIMVGKTANFAVTDASSNNSIYGIKQIAATQLENENFSSTAVVFTSNVITKNIFSVFAREINRTQIVNIAIEYYSNQNGYVQFMADDLAKVLTLEFATYLPISEIELSLESEYDVLTYVDASSGVENAKNYSVATINYLAKSNTLNYAPTKTLYFANGNDVISYSNPSKILLKFSRSIENLAVSLNYFGNAETNSNSGATLNSLNGKIELTLNGQPQIDNLEFVFQATTFNNVLETAKTINVRFQRCAVADGVVIMGNDLVSDGFGQDGSEIYSIYISYLGCENLALVKKSFNALARYDSATLNSFKLNKLGYSLSKFNTLSNQYEPISSTGISVSFDEDNLVTINSINDANNKNGGQYLLNIFSLDSYNSATGNYSAQSTICLRVSDGTKENPFTLANAEEFALINSNLSANYVLVADFEINNMVGGEVEEAFGGYLSGVSSTIDKDGNTYLTKHTLTVDIDASNYDKESNFIGLFAKIGQTGVVQDLDIAVRFEDNFVSNTGDVFIGALAGENRGRIENVSVNLVDGNLTFAGLTLDENNILNFGLLVGANYGQINMSESSISANNLIIAPANNSSYNLGLIAGQNNGAIVGNFMGKQSLNDVNYTVVANVQVKNENAQNSNINFGAIAGVNTKLIKQVIVGGKIVLSGTVGTGEAILGGISAISYAGDGADEKGIFSCAVLGLDLTNNLGAVAGIVAKLGNESAGGELYDVKVISTQVKFFNNLTTSGQIYGAEKVGGFAAIANSGKITNATLESFVTQVVKNGETQDFYTLYSETNQLASFVYEATSTTISSAFANVNLGFNSNAGVQLYFTSPSAVSETATYFVGKVQNFELSKFKRRVNSKSNFVVVYDSDNFYYKQTSSLTQYVEYTAVDISEYFDQIYGYVQGCYGKNGMIFKYVEEFGGEEFDAYFQLREDVSIDQFYKIENGEYVPLSQADEIDELGDYYIKDNRTWAEFVKQTLTSKITWSENTGTPNGIEDGLNVVYELSENENVIKVSEKDYNLPYLVENGEKLQISTPNEIKASFNKDYIIYINSILIENDNHFENDYNISEVVIVDYFELENSSTNSVFNTHYLINKNRTINGVTERSGLIDLELDENAQTGIAFELVSDTGAYLTADGERIVFTAVSNQPIVVRAYSIFNPQAEKYFAFFTQYGVSNLTLTSSASNLVRSAEAGADYEISLNMQSNGVSVTVDAENIFNLQKFKSIFTVDKANSAVNNLVFKAVKPAESVLDVTEDRTLKIAIKDDADFDSLTSSETIEIQAYLNLTQNFGEEFFPKQNGNDQLKQIGSLKLMVNIFKSTQSIIISDSAYVVDSESHIKFDVNLTTGYVKANDAEGSLLLSDLNIQNNVVSFNEVGKDSLVLTFNKGVENGTQLQKLLDATNVGIANLFDYSVSYKYYYEQSVVKGYTYSIELSIKNEFNYRYFEPEFNDATNNYVQNNVELTLTITSTTMPYAEDENLAPNLNLTFTPTQFQSARFYNYTAKNFEKTATEIMDVNPIDTSTISPAANSYGSVMVIHLEPSYANVTSATLTCTPVNVPGVGEVRLAYEQLVYNPEIGFSTLPVSGDAVENGINLKLTSNFVNGKLEYDGKIYVHVMVVAERSSGYTAVLTSRLTVNVLGQNEPIVREKELTTEFLPGVDLQFDSYKVGNGYLIQEQTVNPVSITLYGYEFNNTPIIGFEWVLDGEKDAEGYIYGYKYKNADQADEDKTIIVDKAGKEFNINSFVEIGTLKDYSTLVANPDGSYTYTFNIYTHEDIPASFKLTAQLSLAGDNGELDSETKELILHPVEFLVNSVYVANLNNGSLNTVMSATHRIDLEFLTNNPNLDLSSEIYNSLIENIEIDGRTGVAALAHAFSYSIVGVGGGYFDSVNVNQFLIRFDNNHIYFTALAEAEIRIELNLAFKYRQNEQTGRYEIVFGAQPAFSNSLRYAFNVIIRAGTNEAAPITISSGQEFVEKLTNGAQNLDFILMDDIDLYDYAPIDATQSNLQFSSLDGNNKVIRIHNFQISSTTANYGLFAKIGTFVPVESGETKATTLKNVIVDYSDLDGLNILKTESISKAIFGGLVAENNGGIIYNCDVMNVSNRDKEIDIVFAGFVDSEVSFGGLVGENQGVITSSRVGRAGYNKILLDSVTHLNENLVWQNASPINFVLGTPSAEDVDANGFKINAGGFVGVNAADGIIASSYVANTGVKNYSARQDETNLTAGFVANNSGDVRYSYVKALESTITSSSNNVRATGVKIESAGNGNVAGFVYSNNGNVTNCFANTELFTDSALLSGFVYINNDNAVIESCYSACTLNLRTERFSYAEQPFVGVDGKQELLSFGEIKNCYFLEEEISSYNLKVEQGKPNAIALNKENFNRPSNLNGFVFINSERRQESDLGVWSYYTMDTNQRHILPELTTANQIAYSYRYLVNEEENIFANAPSYLLGSKNNPYIIRSAKEFNSVLTGTTGEDDLSSRQKSQTGYIRLINNISFANDSILTRADFTFGDKTNSNNLTSLEGNGMTISNISLDVLEDDDIMENEGYASLEKVGLFAEIYNSFIKNINLQFAPAEHADKNPTTPIKYSGGIAGTIDNSFLINLNLTGNNTTLAGKNFVGGVAGIISGKSLLHNIEVSINAVSDSNTTSNLYYNLEDYTTIMRNLGVLTQDVINNPSELNQRYNDYLSGLSYAGGVAGVLDLEKRTTTENFSEISVNADNNLMGARANGNIEAGFAGGVAGFASGDVNALKVKFYVGQNTTIHGSQAVGGIFAIGLGKITASQVSARETNEGSGQFTADNNIAAYIRNLQADANATLNANVGNTTLLRSEGVAGGLVGISIAQEIESCYAKSGVELAQTFGGLVGLSLGASIFHSYAVPYVNLNNSLITNVGGLIGEASSIQLSNTDYLDYVRYANLILKTKTPKYSEIAYTFSTIITDNSKLASTISGQEVDASTSQVVEIGNKTIDYLVAKYQTNGVCHLLSNNNPIVTGATLNVFVGQVLNYAKNEEQDVIKYNYGDVFELYKLYEIEKSSQAELFNQMFSDWPTQYWLLNEQRYYPLLIKEDALNYIEIREADDFKYLLSNPNLNYKIVKDIDMNGWTPQGNWIFNVDFTGTLVGDLGEGSTALPKVFNLHLETQVDNNTAGLFKSTTGARIRNVDFVWTPQSSTGDSAISITKNITMVGGLTCYDKNSTFNNINVYVGQYNDSTKRLLQSTGSLISGDKAINGLGGLVATGENTTINNCSFNGNVNATLVNESADVYFGALIASGRKTEFSIDDREEFFTKKLLIMSSSVGAATNFNSNFNITLSGQHNNAYVGGAIGYLEGGAISGINVKIENLNVTLPDVKNNYIAGLAAYTSNTSIATSEVEIGIKLSTAITTTESAQKEVNLAGLVAFFNGTDALLDLTANATLDISKLDATNLNVAGGIAKIATNGVANLSQVVFVGEIISEVEEETATVQNVNAGGAIATADGNVNLNEVFTKVEMTVGTLDTNSLYAGGLVGNTKGALVVSNAVSAGKIVPITSTDAQNIYAGGFAGMAESVNFANSISASSIIADGISSKAISKLNIHALLGGAETDNLALSNVFYSSDISLFPEELCADATNISAYVLTHPSKSYENWQYKLINTGNWQVSESGMPYIANLAEKLLTIKILRSNNSGNIEGYVQGSSLNPINLDNNFNGYNETAFNYYILFEHAQTADNVISLPIETLNGVLIGGECKYIINSGFIGQIEKHSAISNLHLIANDANIELNSTNSGVIAGTNNGVIFNCSVDGAAITISATNTNAGLISGVNNGLVSYSYSAAEIVDLTANSFGAIANVNNGKILSCYFTGYINNNDSTGAGGIVERTEENSFIYNCYMAGVVTHIANSAFSALPIENRGLNNFIDINVNKKVVDEHVSGAVAGLQNVLQTIDTQLLMANNNGGQQLLAGNWFNTVEKADNNYYVNLKATGYGYNYLYPIYNFYKLNSSMKSMATEYALYTGTGVATNFVSADSDIDLNNLFVNDYEQNLAAIMSNNGDNDLYKNAIKVPHLGVLKAIQGIANTIVGGKSIKTNFNYCLIYDIDGQYLDDDNAQQNYPWVAVGESSGEQNKFYNSPDAEFNGLFISNKLYNFTIQDTNNKTTSLCTIQNLSQQGLFTNIRNAYFGFVMLGDFTNLINSGALGVSVNKASSENSGVFVDNVYYVKGANYSAGESSEYISALFGEVDSATSQITIKEFCLEHNSAEYVSISSANNAGLVVGKFLNGTIYFENGNNMRVAFADDVLCAGGLVGEMINGTISSNESNGSAIAIVDNSVQANAHATKLGGIVGKINDGGVSLNGLVQISKINVSVGNNLNCAGFGGLVYEVNNGNVVFKNCNFALENGTAFNPTISNTNAGNEVYYGIICAKLVNENSDSGIKAYNFGMPDGLNVEINLKNVQNSTEDDIQQDNCGFGGLVGFMNGGKLTLSANQKINQTLKVRGTNVGGIVGYFKSGLFAIDNGIEFNTNLYGYNNVGGAMGFYGAEDLEILADEFETETGTQQEVWNFLNSNSGFATIYSFEDLSTNALSTVNFYNWGGLFGYFAGSNMQNATNNNPISIGSFKVSETYFKNGTNPKIYNVGGVAGKVKSGSVTSADLANAGNISFSEQQNADSKTSGIYQAKKDGNSYTGLELSVGSNAYAMGVQYYFAPVVVNVGGIFGIVEDTSLTGALNSGLVVGYQNVGGLVGFAKKSNLLENVETSSSNQISSNIIGAVNVGGGVGLLEESTINAKSQANVYGNYNVGGLVGFVKSGTVAASSVGADSKKVEVKGIYLKTLHYINIPTGTTADAGQFNRAANYFPANVGGLIGSNAANSTISIENNTLNGVFVTSSKEGAFNEYETISGGTNTNLIKTFNNSSTISTIENAILYNNNSTFEDVLDLKSLIRIPTTFAKNDEGKITQLIKFNDMKTGFGGFIGSTDSASVLSSIASNKMQNVQVYAMLGINTGAIFGAYNANLKQGDATIATPTMVSENLYVEGAYNVGGIAGYIYISGMEVDSIKFETELGAGYVNAADGITPTINVQNHIPSAQDQEQIDNLTGIYVGGLFGKLTGKANGLKIDGANSLQIHMTTTNAYYAGGLIGRLEGNLGDESSNTNSNVVNGKPVKEGEFTAAANAPLTIVGDDKENFGGLVGMLKKVSGISETAYVIGWQPYAFTVNTIENSNYVDGETDYDYNDEDNTNLYLIAQAYYVNQDRFEISYSRGSLKDSVNVGDEVNTTEAIGMLEYYGKVIIGSSAWFNNWSHNPFIENSYGWAREYTMFKAVQRNIPAGEDKNNYSGTKEWDSISLVYDASRITYVATVLNTDRPQGNVQNVPTWYSNDISKLTLNEEGYSLDAENVIYGMTEKDGKPKIESLAEHYADVEGEDFEGNIIKKTTDDGHFVITGQNLENFNNHIFFTIYEADENSPQLYSRVGVASLMKTEKSQPVTSEDQIKSEITEYREPGSSGDPVYYGTYYIDVSKQTYKETQTILDPEPTETTINHKFNTLSYFCWMYSNENAVSVFYSENNRYTTTSAMVKVGEDVENKNDFTTDMSINKITYGSNEYTSEKHYVYPLRQTIYNPDGNASGEVYFQFFNMFQNYSANYIGGKPFSDDTISPDGSIFNVSGIIQDSAINNLLVDIDPKDTGWLKALIGVIIAIILVVVSALLAGPKSIFDIILIYAGIAGYLISAGFLVVLGVQQIIENIEKSKLLAVNTMSNRTNISYGFLTSTYARDVSYSYDKSSNSWKMNVATDEYYTKDGEIYYYYSSTRPVDYYDNYYLYADFQYDIQEGENTLTITEFKKLSKWDSRIKFENGVITQFDNQPVNEDSETGIKIKNTYTFEHGVYYINAFAAEQVFDPYQMQIDQNGHNNTQYKIADDGYIYSQGKFSGGKYLLEQNDILANNLYLENDTIKNELNASWQGTDKNNFASESGIKVSFEFNKSINFVPVNSVGAVGTGNTYVEVTDDESGNYIISSIRQDDKQMQYRYYLGYGYMKGVYFAANGRKIGIDPIIGEFIEVNNVEGLNEGADYITVQCNDLNNPIRDESGTPTGEYQKITKFYKFSGITQNVASMDYSFGMDIGTQQGPLYINLYPSSFVNPYNLAVNVDAVCNKDQYFISDEVLGGGSAGISFNATYYYYDGGYVSGNINSEDSLDADGNALVYLPVGAIDEELYKDVKMPIYNDKGEEVEEDVLYIDFFKNSDYYNKYKEYYVADISELLKENANNLIAATYKIGNKYKFKNDMFYSLNQAYNIHAGILTRVSTIFPYAKDEDYNHNKYLINSDLAIYTRYKFVEGIVPTTNKDFIELKNLFENGNLCWNEGEWDDEIYYYLYNPSNNYNSAPNSPKVTHLTESLLVTLGGGQNVKVKTKSNQTLPNTSTGWFVAK